MSTNYSINYINNTKKISSWNSKRMSGESINNPHTSGTTFSSESTDFKNIQFNTVKTRQCIFSS